SMLREFGAGTAGAEPGAPPRASTQFLIVSHNKKTMEACDAIYGVTMEESGVSQLLSVDFRKKQAEPAKAEESAPQGDASSIERTTAS
ncbi:MAG: hypothetical protein AAB339_13065, partial [Elusimicrobiota bacterium]